MMTHLMIIHTIKLVPFGWCKYYKVSINYNSKYVCVEYKSIIKKYKTN